MEFAQCSASVHVKPGVPRSFAYSRRDGGYGDNICLQISSQCASLKESLNSVGTEYESAKFEVETLKEKVSTLESVLRVSMTAYDTLYK